MQEQIWASLALDFQEKRFAIPGSVGRLADHGLPAPLDVERGLEIQYAIAELMSVRMRMSRVVCDQPCLNGGTSNPRALCAWSVGICGSRFRIGTSACSY